MDQYERDDEPKSVRQRVAWAKPRLQAMLPADRTRGGVRTYGFLEDFKYQVS